MNTTETQLEFYKGQDLTFSSTGSLYVPISFYQPAPNVIFKKDNKQIGILSWNDGVMKFEGDVEESAKIFFDNVIKHYLPKSESISDPFKPIYEKGWKS